LEDILYKEVGNLINQARNYRGLTQQELSDLIHLTRPSIANIERGNQKISLLTLYQIADALKVSPQSLLPEIEKLKNGDTNKTTNITEIENNLSPEEMDIINLLKRKVSE
jgi:transcriptional regulator with XRE-family HTH domain